LSLAALWCVLPEQMAGARNVPAFASQLGRTVDFDAVQGELLSTVHHAFQPAHVSIWSAAAGRR
jgi:hypothetical protein